MTTVKDFAREMGCGESIIYRHIRNHREKLGEGVQKMHGRTWLTDEGMRFIRSLMTQHAVIEEKAAPEVVSLQKQIQEQQITIEAQKAVIELLNLKFERYEEEKALLVEGNEKIKLLEAQNADLSAETDELRGKVADAEKTAERATAELTEASAEVERLKKENAALESRTLGDYVKGLFRKKVKGEK